MSEVIEQWKAQLMTLPQDDRAELAHFLLSSLGPEDDEVEPSLEEIARRVDEIRSGRAIGRPVDEFLAELRERYP
jgi:putative addiction module component (TIGR02574 family)